MLLISKGYSNGTIQKYVDMINKNVLGDGDNDDKNMDNK